MAHKILSKVALFTAGVALGMMLKDHVNFTVKTDFDDEEDGDGDDANAGKDAETPVVVAEEPVLESEENSGE